MLKQEITKEFHFEMAHILSNHKGLCGNLHGHSYKLLLTFTGILDQSKNHSEGMIVDFGDIKDLIQGFIDEFDHCFAYNSSTTDNFEKDIFECVQKYNKKTYIFPFRTTAENMSKYILKVINTILEDNGYKYTHCNRIQLYETASGSATYTENFEYKYNDVVEVE